MANQVRVAVNGYGVIGKRIADAVRAQEDMQLVGVSDMMSAYRIKTAVALDIPVFACVADKANEMREAGIPVVGTLDDLLEQVDVILDATPAGIS